MTTMPLHVNILTSTTCRLFSTFGKHQLRQMFRITRQRCLSTGTLQKRKTPGQTNSVNASRIMIEDKCMTLQNLCIPAFCLSNREFSTTTNRPTSGTSPGEVNRLFQEMYGEAHGRRAFDLRNTSKLVTSFPRLPTYELKKEWLLHVYPSYYLGSVDGGFSARQFMGGADMAVEPILEAAGSGKFEQLNDFMDEKTIEEMRNNRKNVNVELLNILSQDVIFDLSFRNENSLCSCEIEHLDDRGSSRVNITGVLRGDAMMSTVMGQFLYKTVSPIGVDRPHIPMDLNIHFLFRCTREYTYNEPHRDWAINGFSFLIDIPDLFIVYIL